MWWIIGGIALGIAALAAWAISRAPVCRCGDENCGGGCWNRRPLSGYYGDDF